MLWKSRASKISSVCISMKYTWSSLAIVFYFYTKLHYLLNPLVNLKPTDIKEAIAELLDLKQSLDGKQAIVDDMFAEANRNCYKLTLTYYTLNACEQGSYWWKSFYWRLILSNSRSQHQSMIFEILLLSTVFLLIRQ